MNNQTRLDASESIFFARQLESIDERIYEQQFPLLKARQLLPAVTNIGEWDLEYTWRKYTTSGTARFLGDKATDMTTATVKAEEETSRIKNVENAFSYTLPEIRAAMSRGVPLDDFGARAARRAQEEFIDQILAFGSTSDGMRGFVNSDDIVDYTTFSPTDKGGGATSWLTSGVDPLLIVDDINAAVSQVWSALKEAQGLPSQVTLVVPAKQYAFIAGAPVSTLATRSILDYVRTNPMLADVVPWHKLTGACHADTSKDRMIAYVRDPMVCGSIVPLDFMRQPEQMVGLNFNIPCISRCGGAVIRYPVALAYCDKI